MLAVSGGMGIVAAVICCAMGVRHPIALSVAGLTALGAAGLLGAIVLDILRRIRNGFWPAFLQTIRDRRRTYAGFLVHAGFACLAIGVTGSSLGTIKHDVDMEEGETIQWAGRSIHFVRLMERELPDKTVIETHLEVSRSGTAACTLLPAQHFHRPQHQWTTEVAIHSTWGEDFYAIVHGGQARGRAHLTFVINPMMRWLWLGGWIAGIGALCGLLPARRRVAERSAVAAPHWTMASCHERSSRLGGPNGQ